MELITKSDVVVFDFNDLNSIESLLLNKVLSYNEINVDDLVILADYNDLTLKLSLEDYTAVYLKKYSLIDFIMDKFSKDNIFIFIHPELYFEKEALYKHLNEFYPEHTYDIVLITKTPITD